MKEKIENHQVMIYFITIIMAIIVGLNDNFQWILPLLPWALAILMYAMFLQIPFLTLKQAFHNRRFMWILLLSNFVIIPIIVGILIQFLPKNIFMTLGVLLVLLTPCIDYVIVFTKLGQGNEQLMLIATPLLFIVQIILLPIYIWIFLGTEFISTISIQPFVESFITLIVLPFALALFMQKQHKNHAFLHKIYTISEWLPVPMMAIVLFIIIASQIPILGKSLKIIQSVIPIYIVFMIITFIASYGLGQLFKLNIQSTRTLIYSSGTRNSLVVLTLALALPKESATIVATVIVTQTIIELMGELVYLQITPRLSSSH